jgi:hypothetical protein
VNAIKPNIQCQYTKCHYVESHCAKCLGAITTKIVLKRRSLQDGQEGDEATGQREMALNEPHFALVPSEKEKNNGLRKTIEQYSVDTDGRAIR